VDSSAAFLKELSMPSKKCRCNNCKCKIKVKQKATLAKKGEAKKDTLKSVEGRPPANVSATFKVKLKRK